MEREEAVVKFDEVNAAIAGVPYMKPARGRQVYNHLIEHRLGRVLELGFAHGKSTCYLAAAVDELGGDAHVLTMDKSTALHRDPDIRQLLDKTGLAGRVTPVFAETSFTWELMKLLEQTPRPRFDFVYLDGGHTWDVTGFTFFLVDQLLAPGGWLLFDDLDWTIAKSAGLRNVSWAQQLPEDQRSTPQVRKVFELLVRQHPEYVDVRDDRAWGWARKEREEERSGRLPAHDDENRREQIAVRAGWELVELLGQLEERTASQMLRARWDADRSRAAALAPLSTGTKIGDRMREIYEAPANQTRCLRILELLRPGDRVFEIGPGRGYPAGLMLRDRGVGAYQGVDVDRRNLDATRELLSLNGLMDRAELRHRDIYDLTQAELTKFGADIVVCCEVLEHLVDPELAVATLAAALPSHTDLLLSVPLLGRLETVWGHRSVFDAARIRNMVENAGLSVHAVDVVDNVWVFVLASRKNRPSERAARAAATAAVLPVDRDVASTFQPLPLGAADVSPISPKPSMARCQLEIEADGVRCELRARRGLRPNQVRYGGIRLPVPSLRGIRLQLGLDDIEQVKAIHVDALAEGKRVGRWTWFPAKGKPTSSSATFVLRPGVQDRYFRPGKLGDLGSADAVEVVVAVRTGQSARVRLTQAAMVV